MHDSLEHRAGTAQPEPDPVPAQPLYTVGELVEMYSRTIMLGVGMAP
ncbi:hypothetical protein H7J86_26075 [Mycobacterium hackensackense]|nr:hypothetical protein [Mycobacterium hackensackense]MCV7255636.1 hypothetical protein [Mycobacterium hackensackense]